MTRKRFYGKEERFIDGWEKPPKKGKMSFGHNKEKA